MTSKYPDKNGYYGSFGGRFAPETLMASLAQLENQYQAIKKDKSFKKEFEYYLKEYAGRPTNLYLAKGKLWKNMILPRGKSVLPKQMGIVLVIRFSTKWVL